MTLTGSGGHGCVQGDIDGDVGQGQLDGAQSGLLLVGREGQDLAALQLGGDRARARRDRRPEREDGAQQRRPQRVRLADSLRAAPTPRSLASPE